jgi:hypothetical protein
MLNATNGKKEKKTDVKVRAKDKKHKYTEKNVKKKLKKNVY